MQFFVNNSIHHTEVYDTYWRFAYERQNIFMKKVQGLEQPWTTDKILQKYKFTNAYRASDRVSQFLIRNVIYVDGLSAEDVLFRILLFKIFNKIETWEYLEKQLGEICYKSYSYKNYSSVLNQMFTNKMTIYSNAYIMPSGKNQFGNARKFENHLSLIELMIDSNLLLQIDNCKSLQQLYLLLLQYPTIGSFLAFQYAIDINYSELCDFNEMEFVVPGPGAKSGIRKCFSDIGRYTEADIIRYVAENQVQEFSKRNLEFKNLWGRNLQLIDCQNLFCETDKYSRVAHPNIKGLSNRTRIKQRYTSSNKKLNLFYPPKWNLNLNY